ncbi:MIP family channel protein [Methanimicrococcus blatticola]|uniref:MIP family channel protein n=1 Tax=Methanimicrococcus blatticola TaxID=91560 RepID=A0A484F6H8_9EURY|nr:MIP family channel protein [Methanimicrococcus blatticola]MBZ3935658.1 MIP family channel protein [Methanimicrococcus blatticola]MCC2508220.1 MIP family channel protein [Methanimicrococcus blatticola]TDQ68701.1 MIP family channel protein [Methanimicrococcus blatticola]
MNSIKKYIAEAIGTMVLVLFGCGSAAIAGSVLGTFGIAMAFGLSIVAMAYVIGNISGCHVNPAVSIAMLIDKRLSPKDFVGYVVFQVIGAIVGIALLAFIINSADLGGFAVTGLGQNGFDEASAVGLSMIGAIIVEIILTFVFVFTILGVTDNEKTSAIAGIVIGLTLVFVHIMGIPLTGTSVNPARSLAPALLIGGLALQQVWVFIIAPLIGGSLAALVYRVFKYDKSENKA